MATFFRSLPFLFLCRRDRDICVCLGRSRLARVIGRTMRICFLFHTAHSRVVPRGIFAFALGIAHPGAGYTLHVILRVAQFQGYNFLPQSLHLIAKMYTLRSSTQIDSRALRSSVITVRSKLLRRIFLQGNVRYVSHKRQFNNIAVSLWDVNV